MKFNHQSGLFEPKRSVYGKEASLVHPQWMVSGAGLFAASPERFTSALLAQDPYYSKLTVMLPGSAADLTGGALDWLGNVWTFNGNAAIAADELAFDGNGDYLSSTIASCIGTGNFLIQADITPASLTGDGEIFCISAPDMLLSGFDLVFEVKTTGALRGSIQNGAGTANVDLTSAAGLLSTGTKKEVAFGAVGSNAYLWINGVVVANGAITGARVQNNSACRIGHLTTNGGVTRYFNGKISNVRVTNFARVGTAAYVPESKPYPKWQAFPYTGTRLSTLTANDAQAVATDGTTLWYTSSTTIYKYTKAGALVTSRNVSADSPADKSQINGVAYRNGRLFVSAAKFAAGVGTSWIVEYDPTTLAYVQQWSIPGDWFSEGLAWCAGYWWVVFHATKSVAQLDANFNLLRTYPLSLSITGNSGGYGAGTGYDGIAWIGTYMLANIHEIYNEKYLDVYFWDGTAFLEVARLRHPTNIATQGLAIDPVEPGVLWMAERNTPGNDSIAKISIV